MYTAPKNVYRDRVDFAKIDTAIPIPNLIEIQKNSYERFLQMRVLPGDREDAGLQSVFKSVFPITDLRENCSLEVVDYSMLAKPHWVDVYVERMKEMVVKRVTVKVAQERVSRLDLAVRRITQRVNLFEKILIPSTNKNIQRIRIFLGDAERSAIVRSKIAKAMHQKQRKQMIYESEA